jgi:signal recognition particle GTPase
MSKLTIITFFFLVFSKYFASLAVVVVLPEPCNPTTIIGTGGTAFRFISLFFSPVPMMVVGLQGSGKTTTTAKLARYLENTKKKKVMMVSLDIYRPAAQEQLKSLGEQNDILTLPVIEGQQPADICQRAISAANLNGADIILFDTAGRTQIDLQMMTEIKHKVT